MSTKAWCILALALTVLSGATSVAAAAEVYLVPEQSNVSVGTEVAIELWLNATEFKSGQINMTYDSGCINVTNYAPNRANFQMNGWAHYEGHEWITFMTTERSLTGNYQIGTLTVLCAGDGSCGTRLVFDEASEKASKLYGSGANNRSTELTVDWQTGTFDCTGSCDVFDTGAGTYPSIAGTHNGTITPYQDIVVDTMYTYPCPGTGGHSEHIRIWNESGWNVTANWDGYDSDYHFIGFDTSFRLLAQQTYNYTIRTGSYPQVHHRSEVTTDSGVIRCDEFTDVNGRVNKWVPAIRLFLE